ncbi:MAG: carbohydrate-binding domain-containing protein [Clostridia bacterium]|nr:carbohydrate-binding domain-containing protein [Clostridia bacterium]
MKFFTKRILPLGLCALLCLSVSSCKGKGPSDPPAGMPPGGMMGGEPPLGGDPVFSGDLPVDSSFKELPTLDVAFPDDATGSGKEIAGTVKILFDGKSATVTPASDAVTVENGLVTVKKAGSYHLSGSFEGQLQVDTADEQEVLFYLDGTKIVSPDSAAIYVISAPNTVTRSLLEGSTSILEDGKSYQLAEGADEPSATLFSKEDLQIEGNGALFVTSNSAKGIYSKDDLKIKGGTITVAAADDGIRGKDSLTITAGTVVVVSGADGLKTSNTEDSTKGSLFISGGSLQVEAADDGIDAVNTVTISGGTLSILTGEGSTESTGGGNFGGGGRPVRPRSEVQITAYATEATGGKGVKSDVSIIISGGNLTVDSADDALHAAELVEISGGTLSLAASDDGIHCDSTVRILGGNLNVTRSYEGIEGQFITLSGGKTYVTASDDGFNATDGSSTGGMGGGMMGTGQDCSLTFEKDCYVVVNAAGDGLDSNGNAYQTGGTVIAFGPTNSGNGTIDTGDGRENGYFFTGGNLLAVGSSGMAENIDTTLPALYGNLSTLQAGTALYILDESGSCVVACTLPKAISNIVFASSACQSGDFTVYSGGTLPTLTDSVAFFPETAPTCGTKLTLSASGGNMGGGGFRPR